jgi:hypothetical protein
MKKCRSRCPFQAKSKGESHCFEAPRVGQIIVPVMAIGLTSISRWIGVFPPNSTSLSFWIRLLISFAAREISGFDLQRIVRI